MNQLGFVVCFIFTTLIAVSTPADIFTPGIDPLCPRYLLPCGKDNHCCNASCEHVASSHKKKKELVCICKFKGIRCTKGEECCTRTCTGGVCACGKEEVYKKIKLPCHGNDNCCGGATCKMENGNKLLGSCKFNP